MKPVVFDRYFQSMEKDGLPANKDGASASGQSVMSRPDDVCAEGFSEQHTPFVVLPSTAVFKWAGSRGIYSIDYGGSLVKVAYTSVETSEDSGESTVLLKFRKFQCIEQCLSFIKAHSSAPGRYGFENVFTCTGGGSYKHGDLISDTLGVRLNRVDETEALVSGCIFLLKYIEDESFTYHHEEEPSRRHKFQSVGPSSMFPFLLVSIGTGMSIIKVESEEKFLRVGGSTMGGGAFTGLGSLLTGAKSFDELLLMAEKGDHRNIDVLVSDLVPTAKHGLPADLIAGSFGKCVLQEKQEEVQKNTTDSARDVSKSLLLMFSNSIGQNATLYGKLHNVNRIYFGGYFIRKHPITMRTISFAVNYWSKGHIEASFLRHEGYIGAVGALLKKLETAEM